MKSKCFRLPSVEEKKTYPHMGLYLDGTIVLFYKEGKGIVIHESPNAYPTESLGKHLDNLNNNYEVFHGTVELSGKLSKD